MTFAFEHSLVDRGFVFESILAEDVDLAFGGDVFLILDQVADRHFGCAIWSFSVIVAEERSKPTCSSSQVSTSQQPKTVR